MKQEIWHGDCLELMKNIPDKSVDMILCDPPYGIISSKWDTCLPLEKLWIEYNRVIKNGKAIAVFSNEPFTSILVCSNLKGFKYRWNWNKVIPAGMSYARFRPMEQIEDICIFSKDGKKIDYFPQMIPRTTPIKSGGTMKSESAPIAHKDPSFKKTYDFKNPTTLLTFNKVRRGSVHPTQKPVDLLEYLIKTYTQEGDLVLDNCAGSGSTLVAAKNLNRQFIGIEKEKEYYDICVERLK